MKRFLCMTVLGMLSLFCGGCGEDTAAPWRGNTSGKSESTGWQYVDTAMGTVINQTLYADGEEAARAASEEVMEILTRLEKEKLSWRLETSEVYRINASAGNGEGYPLSEDMEGLLSKCLELSERSDGAFDITVGRMTRLWNIDRWAVEQASGEFQIPSGESLEEALQDCGYEKLGLLRRDADGNSSQWNGQGGTVYLDLPEGMQLDFGAVGKGFALMEIGRRLEERPDIEGAVISVGGSILTYGSKPDGSAWKVGIVDPFDTASSIAVLSLQGQWCVSTSGDYERFVESGGVRYHHILNPDTGFPADAGVRGVTVLTRDGVLGDALSTACFILGEEKGMALAAQYDAEVLFVLADGRIVMSDGMGECARLVDR